MLALVACLLTASCSTDDRLQGPSFEPPLRGPFRPMVSALSAAPGSRIAIAIEPAEEGLPVLAGLIGELQFDPAKLTYAGQDSPDSLTFPLVVVNDAQAAQGRLRVLSLDPRGLAAQTAVLAFEVRVSDYAGSVRYRLTDAVTTAVEPLAASPAVMPAGLNPALVAPPSPVRLTPKEWQALEQQFRSHHPARLIDSVPAGRRYGDIDTSGTITIVDASRASNWAVGNQSPPGQPIPAPGDFAELAGNVAPVNAPGLGEAADSKGPGWDASCVRQWDILDGANISNEAVGNDRPVVGELIPADAVDPTTGLPRRGTSCGVTVPAFAPDSTPIAVRHEFADTTKWLRNHPSLGGLYPRNFVSVVFRPGTSQVQKQAAFDAARAIVVGGTKVGSDGIYIARLVDDGTAGPLVQALNALATLPQVAAASGVGLGTGPQYLKPSDGPNWKAGNWTALVDHAAGANWSLEAIAAPLAWGCETGKPDPGIAVVDQQFVNEPDLNQM